MKHIFTTAVWTLTFLIGAALFWTSNQVQHQQDLKHSYQADIAKARQQLNILTAEWHYLNNPAYLESLVSQVFETPDGQKKEAPIILTDSGELPAFEVVM